MAKKDEAEGSAKSSDPKDQQRGVGGTGPAREKPKEKEPGAEPGKDAAKGAALAASVPAALVAAQMMILAMLIKILKTILLFMMTMLMNVFNFIMMIIMMIVKAVVQAVMAVGAAIAAVVGGAVSAATAAVAAVGTFFTALFGGFVAVNQNEAADTAQRDGEVVQETCSQYVGQGIDPPEPGSSSRDDNAELIYSVLAAWGMSDTNIAGVLGNWDAESTIDPTGVETIFGESHTIGPNKQAAWEAEFYIEDIDEEYAAQHPKIVKAGIGLGQWTDVSDDGGRNSQLVDFADDHAAGEWYDIETQLAFMVTDESDGGDAQSNVDQIHEFIDEERDSVEDATEWFMANWEGLFDGSTGTRIDRAEYWMGQMGSWDADANLADSILDQSGDTSLTADDRARANIPEHCLDQGVVAGDADYSGDISADGWAEPTDTMHITSLWGPRSHPGSGTCRYHDGLDLDGDEGDPYFAAHDGTITSLEWNQSGGWTLEMELSDGSGFLRYLHTHASSNSASGTPEFHVEVGDEVEAGDHIGNIGNTGISFGAHLHFEIHEADSSWVGWPDGWSGTINPRNFLEDQGFEFVGMEGEQNTCG